MQHSTRNTTQSQRVGGGGIQRSPLNLNLTSRRLCQPPRPRGLSLLLCVWVLELSPGSRGDSGSDHRDRQQQGLEARGCQRGCVAYWAGSHLHCLAFPPPDPSFAFFLLHIRSLELPGWRSLG